MSDGWIWVICPSCEGSGGWIGGNGEWVQCPHCEGSEGWMDPDTPPVNPA